MNPKRVSLLRWVLDFRGGPPRPPCQWSWWHWAASDALPSQHCAPRAGMPLRMQTDPKGGDARELHKIGSSRPKWSEFFGEFKTSEVPGALPKLQNETFLLPTSSITHYLAMEVAGVYESARGKTSLIIHHSHNTARQFLSGYTQGFKEKSYLKFMFPNKSRSPLHSVKTGPWIENKIFLKQFQYRCLSEANFSSRKNAPRFAYVLCWFGQGQFFLHSCPLCRRKIPMHLKTSVLRTYFQKCLPEGQQPRDNSPGLKSQIHYHRPGYYFTMLFHRRLHVNTHLPL